MKKEFYLLVIIVLLAPLLISFSCTRVEREPVWEVGCEMDCKVWIRYVDQNGEKIEFGEGDYLQLVNVGDASCRDWVDVDTQQELSTHIRSHNYSTFCSPSGQYHTWVFAAPARDTLTHPRVKAKLCTSLKLFTNKVHYRDLSDDLEVELNYSTPDKAEINLIKVNGEVKWDRSKLSEEELKSAIMIDVYLDKQRIQEVAQ